jgi:hypothetical protein
MSLIVALFLVVIVALLAAVAVSAGSAQRAQADLQLASSRALQAANAGTEWAATRALVSNSCAASSVLNLTQGALNGFTVSVTCTASPHVEGLNAYNMYDITSFAQYGRFGAAGYVSRSVTGRFTNAP